MKVAFGQAQEQDPGTFRLEVPKAPLGRTAGGAMTATEGNISFGLTVAPTFCRTLSRVAGGATQEAR